jgi:hypothetical protein
MYILTFFVRVQLEDVVGLPSGLCNKACGALEGACPWCRQQGIRMHNTTKYIGAVTHTPVDSVHRQNFASEFKDYKNAATKQQLIDLSKARPAQQRTCAQAIASGHRMKRARGSDMTKAALAQLQKEEPYTDVDAFTTRFQKNGKMWNKLDKTVVDPAHELMNLVKDVLHIISSLKDSSMAFTQARRAEEKSNGRFVDGKVS